VLPVTTAAAVMPAMMAKGKFMEELPRPRRAEHRAIRRARREVGWAFCVGEPHRLARIKLKKSIVSPTSASASAQFLPTSKVSQAQNSNLRARMILAALRSRETRSAVGAMLQDSKA